MHKLLSLSYYGLNSGWLSFSSRYRKASNYLYFFPVSLLVELASKLLFDVAVVKESNDLVSLAAHLAGDSPLSGYPITTKPDPTKPLLFLLIPLPSIWLLPRRKTLLLHQVQENRLLDRRVIPSAIRAT